MKYKNLIIASSGGLDSTITIFFLKKLNFKIIGVFSINWNKKNLIKIKILNIINVSKFLNTKFIILNYYIFYKSNLVKNLLLNYKRNNNINIDSSCNNKFKFNILIKYVNSLNYKKIVTGHYSIIKKFKNYNLKISKDLNKNQSYFLYKIKKFIKFVIFPLGYIKKKFLYRIIKKFKNFFYKEKESMGLCFIENKKFKNFLSNFFKKNINYILDEKNSIVGLHIGNQFFTIGQKKNINIESNKNIYIFKKKKHIIFATKNINYLFKIGVIIDKIYLFFKPKINKFFLFKVRHNKIFFLCKIKILHKKKILIIFDKFLNCSVGQSLVIYYKNLCLGGGVIKMFINLINFD